MTQDTNQPHVRLHWLKILLLIICFSFLSAASAWASAAGSTSSNRCRFRPCGEYLFSLWNNFLRNVNFIYHTWISQSCSGSLGRFTRFSFYGKARAGFKYLLSCLTFVWCMAEIYFALFWPSASSDAFRTGSVTSRIAHVFISRVCVIIFFGRENR